MLLKSKWQFFKNKNYNYILDEKKTPLLKV